MPTFNSAQLTAFLNVVHEPAQLYDVRGNLVAENTAAGSVEWPDNDGSSQNVIHTIDLGEGWFLRRMTLPQVAGAPVRISGSGATRPNLQTLMSGITHELRNPLAAILTAASLLHDDKSPSEETTETAMLLNVVRNEARRMASILSEFSLYVKLPQPQPEAFDFNQSVLKVMNDLSGEQNSNKTLHIDNHLPTPLMVYADPLQMHQVLLRLLENAMQSLNGSSSGVITLFSYPQDDTERVVICIEDNGPGFSEEEMQRAFTPFYSTKAQSTGLGLPIAQTAVQAAGGAMWLENRPLEINNSNVSTEATSSGGARVCFALPVAAGET